MAGKVDRVSVQELVRWLAADRQLLTRSGLEVQHRYTDRESGARAGWTLVLVDLLSGDELAVGSDVAFEVLRRRRPWTYKATSDGLTIIPAGRHTPSAAGRGGAEVGLDEVSAPAVGAALGRERRRARVAWA